jgi:hypothetical protein
MARESMNLTQEQWDELQRTRDLPSQRVRKLYDHNAPMVKRAGIEPPRTNQRRISPEIVKNGDRMNKTEFEYSWELEARKQSGEILWWGFEPIKLRLTDKTFYTPDFAVLSWQVTPLPGEQRTDTTLQLVEVKGFLRDDANVKFKMAAELFPFEFLMYRKKKQKEGGGWELMKHLNGASR